MTFKISDDRFQKLLQIEELVNCDIGAGIDQGANLGTCLANATQYTLRSRNEPSVKTRSVE
jgi:hypothetical protein